MTRAPAGLCIMVSFSLAGLAGYGTQICMTYALKFAKAAPAIAMSYLSVVWGLLGGYFFFHEVMPIAVPPALSCLCFLMPCMLLLWSATCKQYHGNSVCL